VDDEILFTDRELDVMSILWRRGSGTVSEVKADLAEELAYTTVLSALQILSEKGFVRHEPEGRAYRYFPTVAPEAAGDSALGRILDKIFHGSAEQLVARLVRREGLTPGELAALRRLLDERLGEHSGEGEP
jgi:BlaI family transcriptional regulator, penicillinase repressor